MRFTCVLLLSLLLCPIACWSQDLILKRNGEQVEARIMDISEGQIKFKEYANQRGQTHFLRTAEVVLVRFQNGTERIFELEEVLGEELVHDTIAVHHNTWTWGQYQSKARADAKTHYRAYREASSLTFATSLLTTPLGGLVAAVGCSSAAPRDGNLDYPDADLFAVEEYKEAYRNAAWQQKKLAVWFGFLGGSAIWGGIVYVLNNLM